MLYAVKIIDPNNEENFYFKVFSRSTNNKVFSGDYSDVDVTCLGDLIIKNTEEGWVILPEYTNFNKTGKEVKISYWKESSGDFESGIIFDYVVNDNTNCVGKQLTLSGLKRFQQIPTFFSNCLFGDALDFNIKSNVDLFRNNYNFENKFDDENLVYLSVDPMTYTIIV